MKKILCVITLMVLLITGCGKNGGNSDSNNQVSFTISGTEITPGEDFAEAYKTLGEPDKYTEAASCYFDGMDKVFTYSGFEVRTYPVGEKDYVQDLCISSDEYKTDKGITVGSTLDDVVNAYGKGYELNGKMYRYMADNNQYVYFFIMNNAVKFFGYAKDVQN